ncbi:MAG: hypothetical protein WA996_19720 [Candidatus Promineifilaceae bacterium]
MTQNSKVAEQLRAQIEAAACQEYSFEAAELKIAASLLEQGKFTGHLDERELTSIIRNVVYNRFANQRIGGRDIELMHNIPAIDVTISGENVNVSFLVHIHKPIVAFLRFRYVLMNDPFSEPKRIQLKRGSLSIRKDTRRFDLKARAALAAIDVESIARNELTDLAVILRSTLSDQMNGYGISGEISEIRLGIGDNCLEVYLEGDCRLVKPPAVTM